MNFLKYFSNPYRDLREANEMLSYVKHERDIFKKRCHDLQETHSAEISRRDALSAADRNEIKVLRAEKAKRDDLIAKRDEEIYELKEQIKGMTDQIYSWSGPAMDEKPLADENATNVVHFDAKLKPIKPRERMN